MMKDAVKLVHCQLHKKGTKKKAEARFIPFQEFDLWKFYITHQYNFSIGGEEIYLWLPKSEFDRKKSSFQRLTWIPVHKVTLYFFLKNEGVLVPVTRFFEGDEYKKVKPLFLKHFEEFQDESHGTKVLEHVREEKGICIKS